MHGQLFVVVEAFFGRFQRQRVEEGAHGQRLPATTILRRASNRRDKRPCGDSGFCRLAYKQRERLEGASEGRPSSRASISNQRPNHSALVSSRTAECRTPHQGSASSRRWWSMIVCLFIDGLLIKIMGMNCISRTEVVLRSVWLVSDRQRSMSSGVSCDRPTPSPLPGVSFTIKLR
jgi:hypothetical protein